MDAPRMHKAVSRVSRLRAFVFVMLVVFAFMLCSNLPRDRALAWALIVSSLWGLFRLALRA